MLTMLTDNILELTGNTPLLHLKGKKIFVKAGFFRPQWRYQRPKR